MSDLPFGPDQQISISQFVRVLARAGSPAFLDNAASTLAEIPPHYHLDRGVALAFFAHESSFGLRGVTHTHRTHSWGNLRRGYRPNLSRGQTPHPFAIYTSWQAGLIDWCALIAERYVARGLATVERAIPVYAPSSDGNRPARYIAAVRALVARWAAEDAAHREAMRCRYVVDVDVGNVRAGAARRHAIVGQVRLDEQLLVEAVIAGERIGDEDRWLRLGARRFVHASLAREEAWDAPRS